MTLLVDIGHRLGDFEIDASFESAGRLTALFGPSGSGKSTLISLSAGLIGTLWSKFDPAAYFLLLAGIAGLAAILLRGMSTVAEPSRPEKVSAEVD